VLDHGRVPAEADLRQFADADRGEPVEIRRELKPLNLEALKEQARQHRGRAEGQRPEGAEGRGGAAHAGVGEKARDEGRQLGFEEGLEAAAESIEQLLGRKPTRAKRSSVAMPSVERIPVAPVIAANGVTNAQQKILNALAWWRAFGIEQPTNEQVGFVAGYSPGSGNFNNLKGQLRSLGFVDYPQPGRISLTDAGGDKADAPAVAVTQAEFHRHVRAKLSGPQLKLFDPVLATYPDSLTSDGVAEAAGYSAGSGNFNNLRGQLRTIGLIDYPRPGEVRAADWLFP
jgi:hypothetical protein